MHQFLKFIFGKKLHVSDSSSVHHQEFFTVHKILIRLASCQQFCMTYTIAVCTVENF